jgi:hypothetical protein
MWNHSKVWNAAAFAILTIACNTSEPTPEVELPGVQRPAIDDVDPTGFHAFAHWDCSPGDSPGALRVYVATDGVFTSLPPEVPHFRISVFRAGSELAHRSFQFPSTDAIGKVQRCHLAVCTQRDEGRVSFGDVRPNQFVEGTLDLGRGDVTERWRFKANWGPRLTGCG